MYWSLPHKGNLLDEADDYTPGQQSHENQAFHKGLEEVSPFTKLLFLFLFSSINYFQYLLAYHPLVNGQEIRVTFWVWAEQKAFKRGKKGMLVCTDSRLAFI